MTMTEFLANPMAPVATVFFVVMLAICIAGFFMDSSPTPEYVRTMAEHNARMAAFEADKPMRIAHYIIDRELRLEAMKAEQAERTAKRYAEYLAAQTNKGV